MFMQQVMKKSQNMPYYYRRRCTNFMLMCDSTTLFCGYENLRFKTFKISVSHSRLFFPNLPSKDYFYDDEELVQSGEDRYDFKIKFKCKQQNSSIIKKNNFSMKLNFSFETSSYKIFQPYQLT